MTTELRRAFEDLAAEAPSRPTAWTDGARAIAGRRRARRRAVASITAGTLAVLAAVGVGMTLPLFANDATAPSTQTGEAPYRIDAPPSGTPSVLDAPIRRAAVLATAGSTTFLVDADGTGPRTLPSLPEADGGSVPGASDSCPSALSEDGARLAWVRCSPEAEPIDSLFVLTLASADVRVVEVAGLEYTATEAGNEQAFSLEWSPDGTAIAFVGANSAAVLELSTGRLSPVPAGFAFEAAWSPDSSRIAFYDNVNTRPEVSAGVFSRDLSSREIVRAPLPRAESFGGWVWGPDGDTLSAVVAGGGVSELLLVSTDGGGEVRRIALRGDVANRGAYSTTTKGWRQGLAVLELVGRSRWVTFDPETGTSQPLISTARGVWINQVPAAILGEGPIVRAASDGSAR
jgi:hypothetical protein